jgi:lysine 2,3-aminomutase
VRPYLDPIPSLPAWSADPAAFSSWKWQLKHRLERPEQLEEVLTLTDAERLGCASTRRLFRFATTPYYVSLASKTDPACPVRRQIVPSPLETHFSADELSDPLGEERLEVVPNLIHRYPDRVLLLATDRCPVYCRFCTRRRIVGRLETQAPRDLLRQAFDYISHHREIREVIVSGGDALMLGDNQLAHILTSIRAAEHVEIIRIATRMPVTCPMRVTDSLVKVLAVYPPLVVMTHFNHPLECTQAAANAAARLVNAGIPVYNQSVLLRDLNDRVEIIEELNRRLLSMRITPHYLHQCDMAQGIEHFRTPLQRGIDIIDGLRGRVSGLMVPQMCVDVPGGLGKVTVQPNWLVKKIGQRVHFRTYQGTIGEYLDPPV